jgi:hypothetical protein
VKKDWGELKFVERFVSVFARKYSFLVIHSLPKW